MGGTDSNVFICIYGKKGDSGKRQLKESETHRDKFERGHEDVFTMEIGDLGELYKIDISQDNSMLKSDWFLSRVEISELDSNKTYVFHCERWLAKGKDDKKTERTLFVKVRMLIIAVLNC